MLEIQDIDLLFSGIFMTIDLKSHDVLVVKRKGEILASNVAFENLPYLVAKLGFCFDDKLQIDDILFFLKSEHLVGTYLFPFKRDDGIEHYYQILKQVNLEKNEIYIYLEGFDDPKKLADLSDPLTKVYQRFTFTEIVKNEINSKRNRKFAFMVADVDDFKGINDTYGHKHGDTVLASVADCFKKHIQNGYIGRIGGDEFAMIDFDSISLSKAKEKAKSIINDVSLNNVTITIGISMFPTNAASLEDLYEKADKNMYKGKNSGKNKVVIDE